MARTWEEARHGSRLWARALSRMQAGMRPRTPKTTSRIITIVLSSQAIYRNANAADAVDDVDAAAIAAVTVSASACESASGSAMAGATAKTSADAPATAAASESSPKHGHGVEREGSSRQFSTSSIWGFDREPRTSTFRTSCVGLRRSQSGSAVRNRDAPAPTARLETTKNRPRSGIFVRGIKGVPRKGVRTSVNMRV